MKLLFSYEVDESIQDRLDAIRKYTDAIEKIAENHICIMGLEYIGIKLIVQKLVEGYEEFVRPMKPKFKKQFTHKNPIFGDVSYAGHLTFELLFEQASYEALISSDSETEIRSVLKQELLKSENIFQEMKSKLGDIDIEEFRSLITKVLA